VSEYETVKQLSFIIIVLLLFVTENLAPSEIKKLRNKRRKALRKAELERQQAAQAQEKREQHNKSRQQGDTEPDAPQQDELVPEKLARVRTCVSAL
jgi:peptide alpha-N-acetyltransferase